MKSEKSQIELNYQDELQRLRYVDVVECFVLILRSSELHLCAHAHLRSIFDVTRNFSFSNPESGYEIMY